jgi:SseB protein N-terminal domain
LVARLADEPTVENRDAFYRALLTSEVAVPLQSVPPGLLPGRAVASGQVGIPRTRGPDGSDMLLVYADEQSALQAPQAQGGLRVAGRVVLEMAAANRAGVIVVAGSGAGASWSGVPAEHVRSVLAEGDDPPVQR